MYTQAGYFDTNDGAGLECAVRLCHETEARNIPDDRATVMRFCQGEAGRNLDGVTDFATPITDHAPTVRQQSREALVHARSLSSIHIKEALIEERS